MGVPLRLSMLHAAWLPKRHWDLLDRGLWWMDQVHVRDCVLPVPRPSFHVLKVCDTLNPLGPVPGPVPGLGSLTL